MDYNFPVRVAKKGFSFGNAWWLKTNVTTPILQNHGIEYQFYLNSVLVDNAERSVTIG